MKVNSKQELRDNLRSRICYQEIEFQLSAHYGPEDFFFKIKYGNQNKKMKYQYLVSFKCQGHRKEIAFSSKSEILNYFLKIIDSYKGKFYVRENDSTKIDDSFGFDDDDDDDDDDYDDDDDDERCEVCGSKDLELIRRGDSSGYTHKVEICNNCGNEITV